MSHLNMLNAFNKLFKQVRHQVLEFTVIEASQCIVHDNIYGLIMNNLSRTFSMYLYILYKNGSCVWQLLNENKNSLIIVTNLELLIKFSSVRFISHNNSIVWALIRPRFPFTTFKLSKPWPIFVMITRQ